MLESALSLPLPLELEQEIFTMAATIHEETMPTLLRVASRVFVWVEPLLYRTLIFDGTTGETGLSIAVQSIQAKPCAFVHKNVRNIFWWHPAGRGEEHLCTLLSLCTGVENLVLWNLTPAMVPFILSLQRLRRLTSPTAFHQLSRPAPLAVFTGITHLHLHSHYNGQDLALIQGALSSSLTHLAFPRPGNDYPYLLSGLLKECRKLQVVVCTVSDSTVQGMLVRLSAADPWIDDPRLVILRFDLDAAYHVRDWKRSARAGRRDFWVIAEEFLAKKRMDKSITTQVCGFDFDSEDR